MTMVSDSADRSIPAHAGETRRDPALAPQREVDPRSRGGDIWFLV